MGQQSQEKPKIQPLNPEKRQPEPKQPAKPKRKLPRFLIRFGQEHGYTKEGTI